MLLGVTTLVVGEVISSHGCRLQQCFLKQFFTVNMGLYNSTPTFLISISALLLLHHRNIYFLPLLSRS